MTAGPGRPPAGQPVEEYLDRLLLTLSGPPRQVRHTLAEVEAHLHDAVAEAVAAGVPEHEAQLAAVRRVGPVQAVTGRTALSGRPAAAMLRRCALAGSLVGGVALVAIGISAALVMLGTLADGISTELVQRGQGAGQPFSRSAWRSPRWPLPRSSPGGCAGRAAGAPLRGNDPIEHGLVSADTAETSPPWRAGRVRELVTVPAARRAGL
jgi:hypothetical protein